MVRGYGCGWKRDWDEEEGITCDCRGGRGESLSRKRGSEGQGWVGVPGVVLVNNYGRLFAIFQNGVEEGGQKKKPPHICGPK